MRSVSHLQTVFLAMLLTLFAFLTTTVTEHNGGFDSDGVKYAKVAASPSFARCEKVGAPFARRVLTPQLAARLPGPLLDRFRLIALVACVLSLYTLHRILLSLGFTTPLCHMGVMLYAGVFWTLKFSFYSPAYVDLVTQSILLAVILATIANRYTLAVVLLCLGAFQKESLPMFSLFVASDYFFRNSKHTSLKTLLNTLLIIGLPLSSLCFSEYIYGTSHHAAILVLIGQGARFFEPAFWPVFVHAVFSGLGLLPLILLVQHRAALQFVRQRPSFIVYLLLAGAALLGGVDKSRLFNYGLPCVVILALTTIQSWQPVSLPRAIAWATIFMMAHWYIGNYLSPLGPFPVYLAKLVPEHAAAMGGVSHIPFMIRNCVIALVVFVATIELMIGEWSFTPRIGFTRGGGAPAAAPFG